MARKTSVQCYRKIKEEGLLKIFHFRIYQHLFRHGPQTQKECAFNMHCVSGERSITPRFAELKRLGVIKEVGKRECSITGKKVYLWDVTCRMPKGNYRKEKKDKFCQHCNGLL